MLSNALYFLHFNIISIAFINSIPICNIRRNYSSIIYKFLISKVGGKDCCNFLALDASLTTNVYWYLDPLTLNLVCLNFLPLAFNFLLTLTTADLMSALLANSTNSLMSLISR